MASRPGRALIGIIGLAAGCSLFLPTVAAVAEDEPAPDGLLTGTEAVVLALQTGEPVVASALTDEHTLVTADPETGLLTAELSAGVARVPDGDGDWREPSAKLVRAADGSWAPEASAVPLSIAGGAGDAFAMLGGGEHSLGFVWPETLPEPVVNDNLATFAEVAPGVDLVVRAAVDGAESFLVVKDATAAQDPLVRSMPITVVADALEPEIGDSGTVAYLDAEGEARFWVPPAYVWDSAGQPEDASLADLLDPAEGSRVEELPAQVPGTAGRGVGFDASEAAWDLLVDPATVYPVVIDPSATGTQSYAVRVTEDFTKYNSDIGAEGKLGYNGWTSPYYKSRMYYQFRWPLVNGEPVLGTRINSAEFSYVQTHSPQHSCTDTDFGPAVKLQFHNTISSDTTWSNQPGVHSGSGSVSSDYAVGHEDVCNKTYTQKWNVSTMVKNERRDSPTRTTVTVGLRSADEGDKNGWREYKHSSGSSPKLTIVYQATPAVPTGLTFTPQATSGVTSSLTPVVSARVSLPSGESCVSTNCLQAQFLITKPGTSTVTLTGGKVANGGTSSVTVPAGTLADLQRYTIQARTVSADGGGISGWTTATTMDVGLDIPPPAPTQLELLNGSGSVVTGNPPLLADPSFSVRATMPPGSLCPGETPECLTAEITVRRGTEVLYGPVVVPGSFAPEELVPIAVDGAGWDGGHTVSVQVKKSWATAWSDPATLDFTAEMPPAKPVVSALLSPPGIAGFRIQLSPAPLPSYTYHWRVEYTDLSGSAGLVVHEGTVDGGNQVDVAVAVAGPGEFGEASVTVRAEIPGRVLGPLSDALTFDVFG